MLQEIIKDKVMTLKLVTGEEVITKVTEVLDDRYRVSKPFAFITVSYTHLTLPTIPGV